MARDGARLRASAWIDATRQALQLKHYSRRTQAAYLGWLRRFLRFRSRHAGDEIQVLREFLTRLAARNVSTSTQKQALSAIRFAFDAGLRRPLPWLDDFTPAYRPPRLPVVLAAGEVEAVLRAAQWLEAVNRDAALWLGSAGRRGAVPAGEGRGFCAEHADGAGREG